MAEYSIYGGFDEMMAEIDVSDLQPPGIIVGGRPSASTVSGRLKSLFSNIPRSSDLRKLYHIGQIIKKMGAGEEIANMARICKVVDGENEPELQDGSLTTTYNLDDIDAEPINVARMEPIDDRGYNLTEIDTF
jgi:hypothetical protein